MQYDEGSYKFYCTTAGLQAHNTCCASAYQLICKRTTAVVRLTEVTFPATYTYCSNNLSYLFRQLIKASYDAYSY
ncbi:hypothetical protein F7D81_07760 [Prevotella copri]|nr:hypothetical protein [Segatella copri]